MKMVNLHSCFTVLLFILSIFSTVFSRATDEIPQTYVLDVSALLRQSTEILSFNPISLHTEEDEQEVKQLQGNSSLTIKLYSVDTLSPAPFKSYGDLSEARLKRGTARANYISQKVQVVKERNGAGLTLKASEIPVVVGTGGSEYFTRFGIGTPVKLFNAIMDTGSNMIWIQCTLCSTTCFKQTDPIFDPSKSTSYKPFPCTSPICKTVDEPSCSATKCNFKSTYADGASGQGEVASETFTVGTAVIKDVAFGCSRDSKGNYYGSAGMLGLGWGPFSLISQMKATSFSYCLVNKDSTAASTLTIGSSMPADAVVVPMLAIAKAVGVYAVNITGVSIGGKFFPVSYNGSTGVPFVVDCGGTVTRIPAGSYKLIRDEFVKGVKLPLVAAYSYLDTCFNASFGIPATIPSVAFHFGAKTLLLPPNNVFALVGTPKKLCFGIAGTPTVAIFGNTQQQGMRINYDLTNSLVGFSTKSVNTVSETLHKLLTKKS